MYPFQVKVTKKFEQGHFKGLTLEEDMGFITERDARTWAEEVSYSERVNYVVKKMVDLKNNRIIYYNKKPNNKVTS